MLPFFFRQSWLDIIASVMTKIIIGVAIAVILALIYFFRDRIKKWFFARKIKPVYDSIMSAYEEKVLPGYIDEKPKIKVQLRKEDLPSEPVFGYIFVPAEDIERGINMLLTCVPVSSSLRGIRLLFDEKLRKSLFNYLSYKLCIETGRPEVAVRFRDKALKDCTKEYETIEKLYGEGKLTLIILNEAVIRYRKSKGKPSTSDVKEFSRLVRKLVEIDVKVIRIGDNPTRYYVKKAIEGKRGTVLLARGHYINKAVEVADILREKGFELYKSDELGFSNPEIGTWHFIHPEEHDVPLQRIWLKRVHEHREKV